MKKKISLITRILLIGLVPILVDLIILTALSVTTLETELQKENESGLANTAVLLDQALENAYEGEFLVGEDGKLYKGELNLESLYETMDGLKEERDVELTVFYGDTRMLTTLKNADGNRNVGTQANADVVAKVLAGETYFDPYVKISDVDYYGYYFPLHNTDGSVCGMIFAGKPSESVDAAINGILVDIAIVATVLIVIAVAVVFLMARRITTAVTDVTVGLRELTGGNLNAPITEKSLGRSDEVGEMARSTAKLRDTLKQMITEISKEVVNINQYAGDLSDMSVHASQSTNEVSQAVEDIARAANSQAEETENATRYMEDVSEVIGSIVENIDILAKSSDEMGKSGTDATRILAELNDSNRKTIDAIKRITQQTEETNASVMEISRAAEVITSIAEETNLLALNASIEAARAGEHGRGFAVVADSIQKLAEQSNSSAREIMEVISVLIQESEKTVETMKEVNVIVEEEGEKVEETKQIIGRVAEEIDSSLVEIDAMKEKSGTIIESSDQVTTVIQNLAAISQENAASTEETNAAVEELNAMMQEVSDDATKLHVTADHVTELVAQFRI
ncbi:MAG: cache domain-containing protein [Lachnospiraceae bacterium]|nr:cache domain-containing protein [Lachnospiraceae bacterium]